MIRKRSVLWTTELFIYHLLEAAITVRYLRKYRYRYSELKIWANVYPRVGKKSPAARRGSGDAGHACITQCAHGRGQLPR